MGEPRRKGECLIETILAGCAEENLPLSMRYLKSGKRRRSTPEQKTDSIRKLPGKEVAPGFKNIS
jgi:hypothetical protein